MGEFKEGDQIYLARGFNPESMRLRGLKIGDKGTAHVTTKGTVYVCWNEGSEVMTINVHDHDWTIKPITEFIEVDPQSKAAPPEEWMNWDSGEPPIADADTKPLDPAPARIAVENPWTAFWRKIDAHLSERREFYLTVRGSEMIQ
jgi:hypothetical protein